MTKRLCLLFIFIFVTKITAQESTYDQIKNLYENFEYDKVIQKSTEFLAQPQLSDSVKINIYLMRAVSFFAFGNSEQTKNSFQNIIAMQKDYSPTNQLLNPTLLKLFNTIKLDYLKKIANEEAKKDSTATVSQIIYKKQISFGGAFVKNMILPGWGQLSLGKDRGLIYSLAYIANVGALIYYASEASKKQDAYQRETDPLKFDQLYSDYNKSYKMRNNLLISYAFILLYTQLDLLIFHDEEQIQIEPNKVSLQLIPRETGEYNLSIRFPL